MLYSSVSNSERYLVISEKWKILADISIKEIYMEKFFCVKYRKKGIKSLKISLNCGINNLESLVLEAIRTKNNHEQV